MRDSAKVEPIKLPLVPEPVLTDDEKRELSALMATDEFWDLFASQPEPS